MRAFKKFSLYKKEELLNLISQIEIFQEGDKVFTKYRGVVKSITTVSSRYEIFDIKSFLMDKIEQISNNFDIKLYKFRIKRGIQSLTLVSDFVEINGEKFYKSFFILNSTDRSRRLSLNLGLYNADSNYYFISANNAHLFKRHLTGITSVAEDTSKSFSGETFNEQIAALKNLIGEKVMLSKVKEIIVEDDSVKIQHMKFDAFKNQLIWNCRLNLTNEQLNVLRTESQSIKFTATNDISIDAYIVFKLYMMIFNKQDAHVVKKESDRILNITKCFVRQEKLRELFF